LSRIKEKKKKIDWSKLFMRIFVLFLALLMVVGAFYYVIIFTVANSRAYAAEYRYPENLNVRVGLMYGSKVTVGFKTTAEHGFNIGNVDSKNEFETIWQVTDPVVSVTCDCNLKNTAHTFTKTDGTPDIGGYHIQITPADGIPVGNDMIVGIRALLSAHGLQVFPAYVHGKLCIRIGDFSSELEAKSVYERYYDTIGTADIVAPSSTGVSVVNPDTNEILFEFDSADTGALGMTAVSGESEAYLVTPAGNKYEGVFEFKRYITAVIDGVALTNIMPIEQYVEGVLPYEINNSWTAEAQKAMSVAARSYAIANLGKHSSYGFDVCNTTCCQVYKGINLVNAAVKSSVAATKGMILSYNDKIVSTFYSSSTGGTTVSAADCWGSSESSYPYLRAITTPWERYTEYGYGSWTLSFTPDQLSHILLTNGYDNIVGKIVSVKIDSYCKNSTYVKTLVFTDEHGNKATISLSDNIRNTIGLYSANFVVAKAGETTTVSDYALKDFDITIEDNDSVTEVTGVTVITSAGLKNVSGTTDLSGVVSSGKLPVNGLQNAHIITSDGSVTYNLEEELVGRKQIQTVVTPQGKKPDISKLETVVTTRQVTAEGDPGTFVFIGRGWGHGVGLSQWGTKDLADLGYTYDIIITTYFPGTNIKYYYEIKK